LFQSTLPMQGETRHAGRYPARQHVSIHSPYAGRDRSASAMALLISLFQSTLPMQGETRVYSSLRPRLSFQSTLPMQGETLRCGGGEARKDCFNPLSLCRERRARVVPCVFGAHVSIHSPYAGRDPLWCVPITTPSEFQSTLPMQGETQLRSCKTFLLCFNPLSLCRERPC